MNRHSETPSLDRRITQALEVAGPHGCETSFVTYRSDISSTTNWFDPETMRFFGTSVRTGLLPENMFVTSDVQWDQSVAYTVRQFVVDSGVAVSVRRVGEFGAHRTLSQALAAALTASA